jgi:alkyldihydroxyacetonephosphate synthase
VDTVETATTWDRVPGLVARVEQALHGALDEPVHVGTHLSHVYRSGSSAYTTVLFRLGREPATTLERWRRLKTAATGAVVAAGGTVSHQHGVGIDHRDAVVRAQGPSGTAVLAAALGALDPDGRMNPGKLLP